jgi:hypothetical protein
MHGNQPTRSYRLLLTETEPDSARCVDFESHSPDIALRIARLVTGHRRVQLFEDGRELVDLRQSRHPGFWIVD